MSLDAWKDAVIYFVMIDRFCNGDPSNDDQGQGEFDPKDDDFFHGGDLAGLRRRLPYIREAGYDAIWLTPPVHNQWVNPYIRTKGYHGYWAYDFTRVDPHFGTMDDYKAMVSEAHALGLKIIQDIVVNHTGNFFTVDPHAYDPKRPELNWRATGAQAPRDPVFSMNDPRRPDHKKAAVYNFTPNISDFRDRAQTLTWAMGDLDDVNLKSPLAIRRFKEIYNAWIDTGVDGFRVDTVYYTPESFYERFLHDADGVKAHAAARGHKDFLVFGEVWSYDYKAINRYLSTGRKARLDSAIDHPLNEALTSVFLRRGPTEALGPALRAKRPNRHLWINFLDNHDVERIAGRASWPSVRQSLVALMTLPGIPCVTYGTEAGFTRSRQDMFDDRNLDAAQPAAALLRQLISLRKKDPILSRGEASLERASPSAGVLAYRVELGEERRLVVFNTAAHPVFYDLPAGRWHVTFSSEPAGELGAGMVLPPKSFYILFHRPGGAAPAGAPRLSVKTEAEAVFGTTKLTLAARGVKNISRSWLIADDEYEARLPIEDPRVGTLPFDTTTLDNGLHELRAVAELRDGTVSASKPARLLIANPYRELVRTTVAASSKGGLGAPIHPPGDPSYAGQLSMRSIAALTSGRDLRLEVSLDNVTAEWNPPHGFDHVYFSVFLDFPGHPGKKFFPKLNYARDDFEFNAGFLLYGWDFRSFGFADSTPDRLGSALPGEVSCAAQPERRAISFTFSSRFFRGLSGFEGMKIWISTWDGYLGEPRSIAQAREDWNFYILPKSSGRRPEDLPLIYDHALITL